MADYVTERKNELLSTFDDYAIVLVEIFCQQPEWNGRIVAISNNCGGFPSISQAIAAGVFEGNSSATFAITAKCLKFMKEKWNSQEPSMPHIDQKFVENHFGCLLALFFGFIVFILWCFLG